MNIKRFITNPYTKNIYDSFRGNYSDEEYRELLSLCIKDKLGTKKFDIQNVECGVGLSLLVMLSDKSKVHMKILKGVQSFEHQNECCKIQRYLVSNDFPCTVPIGNPDRFLDCTIQFEEYNVQGVYKDSHNQEIMQLQAQSLALLHNLLVKYESDTVNHMSKKQIPKDKVWENPPQSVFSFDLNNTGDEFIKEKAFASKQIIEQNHQSKEILSHEDWSNKHFRFMNDKISVIYDWDSIKLIDELYTIGLACSTFTATWYYPTKIFPSKKESVEFVELYSSGKGRLFSKDEKQIISAYAAYTLSYIARCSFSQNNGTINGNDIENAFNDIENGLYF